MEFKATKVDQIPSICGLSLATLLNGGFLRNLGQLLRHPLYVTNKLPSYASRRVLVIYLGKIKKIVLQIVKCVEWFR